MRRAQWGTVVGLLAVFAAVVFYHSFSRQANQMDSLNTTAAGDSFTRDEKADAADRRVFDSPLAGTWYQADKDGLVREIDEYLDKVKGEPLGNLCALIMPHAGYRYSGQTAAYAVKQLSGRKLKRVIVIGPSHSLPMENLAGLPDATHFATPLGEIPLDRACLSELTKHRFFRVLSSAHEGEHSVGIELPLLQRVLGEFQLVPIVVGQLDLDTTRQMASVLLGLMDPETLVVASSDFTHYGASFGYYPFRDNVADNLKKLDMGAMDCLTAKDLQAFRNYISKTGATICGRDAIGVLLGMLPPEAKAHLLHYDTSGHLTGDYSSSVSYVSVAFTGQWPPRAALPATADASVISGEDRRQLLKLARSTLTYAVKNERMPTLEELNIQLTPAMERVCGAFVTLHKHGQLRGCVGEIYPRRSLHKAVMEQAVNAGLNDTRFPPVQAPEIADLKFEISVLTPPRPVASTKDIILGRHGIILDKSNRSAVFLPQVAVEQRWGLEETLNHLARKAGLSESAWREGASFSVFEAVVFGEGDE